VVLAVRGFFVRRVGVYAQSLTYVTIITVVPFVALVVGLSARFGLQNWISENLHGFFPDEQLALIQRAGNAVAGADLGAFGIPTLILLVYGMLRMLYRVDQGINETWGVERHRGGVKRFFVYLLLVVVGPILAVGAVVVTTTLKSNQIVSWLLHFDVAQGVLKLLIPLFPFLAILVALTVFYQLMPYTRVRWHAALAGALIAAALWQAAIQGFLTSQLLLARYDKVFGALAAIPIFLLWIYTTWMIVFAGAQVSYGIQHARTLDLEIEEEAEDPSREAMVQSALRVATYLAARHDANGRISSDDIAEDLGLPHHRVSRILTTLEERRLVRGSRRDRCRLRESPEEMTAHEIVACFVGKADRVADGHDDPPGAAAAVAELTDLASRALDVPLAELLPDPPIEDPAPSSPEVGLDSAQGGPDSTDGRRSS
jgi:membrane protein